MILDWSRWTFAHYAMVAKVIVGASLIDSGRA